MSQTPSIEKIVIAGGTGFVGKHLVRELHKSDADIVVLTRSPGKRSGDPDYHHVRLVQWSPEDTDWIAELENADAVVNLAGRSLIAGRWTRSVKNEILASRLESVRILVDALKCVDRPPKTFIQASAVGFYGTRTGMNVTEEAAPGSGFLADVCRQWENGLESLTQSSTVRTVILRFGVVMGIDDGFYRRMACMTRRFMGTIPGSGDNWLSWIHVQDLVSILLRSIHDTAMNGVYNAVAPRPIQSGDFLHALAKTWSRPLIPSPPLFILRMTLGEMLDELILASQHVVPHRLMEMNHEFRFSEAVPALDALREECRKRATPVECPTEL